MLISAGDIIKKSIALYRENAKLFLKYMGIIFVPVVIMQLVALFFQRNQAFPGQEPLSTSATMILLVMGITVAVVTFWVSLAFTRVLAARYNGQMPREIGVEITAAKAVFWPGILVSILVGLIVVGGILLLIVPGIIFSIWFTFAFYAVVLDHTQPMDALKASKKLVVGRWWPVFWRLLAPGVVFGLLAIIIQSIAGILAYVGTTFGMAGMFISVIIATASGFLIAPLSTAVPTILYLELKKTPAPNTK